MNDFDASLMARSTVALEVAGNFQLAIPVLHSVLEIGGPPLL
jgi:hypothetical protein